MGSRVLFVEGGKSAREEKRGSLYSREIFPGLLVTVGAGIFTIVDGVDRRVCEGG